MSQLKAVVEQVMISHGDVILMIIIGNQSQLKAVVEQVMINHNDVTLMVIISNQSQLKAVVEQAMINHDDDSNESMSGLLILVAATFTSR